MLFSCYDGSVYASSVEIIQYNLQIKSRNFLNITIEDWYVFFGDRVNDTI